MQLHQNITALLVFSLSVEMDSQRKTIFGKNRKKENRALIKLMIEQTEKVAELTGVDIFWVDEHQQTGLDFATRFTNAIQNLFDKGYENVMAIGNDCPDLDIQLLGSAIEQLQTMQLVLGPSADGGVYLMGMNKAIFDRDSFIKLPWQTSHLFVGLHDHFHALDIEIEMLQTLSDIDSLEDLLHYVQLSPSRLLSLWFKAIIRSSRNGFSLGDQIIPFFIHYSPIGLRAPPTY